MKNLFYLAVFSTLFFIPMCSRAADPVIIYDSATSSILRFYSESGDGDAYSGENYIVKTWEETHDAESASFATYDKKTAQAYSGKVSWGPSTYVIGRMFLPFDTSSIPDDATIYLATLNGYVSEFYNFDNDGYDYIAVVKTFQASTDSIQVSDYNDCGYDSGNEGPGRAQNTPIVEGSDRIDFSEFLVSEYLTWDLNDNGLDWINKFGITKIGLREGHDINNIPYDGPEKGKNKLYISMSEEPGIDKDPYLQVTIHKNVGPVLEPVLVVPGIMGSWEKDGEWLLDPILHTYDSLLKGLEDAGYTAGDNLFTFPYDWRRSNAATALDLKVKINEIKQGSGADKLDLVAHSMGGLVAREYVGSGYYGDDIDQLVFLDTPHLGAPESYVTYEAGAFADGLSGPVLKQKFTKEALAHGQLSLTRYLRENVIGLSELLPVYDYLYDWRRGDWRTRAYPDNYPRNQFLENLNTPDSLARLNERAATVNIYSYQGQPGDDTTISGYKIKDRIDPGRLKWPHGRPFRAEEGKLGFIMGPGDGTVPHSSLSSLPAEEAVVLNDIKHRELPTRAQQDVIEVLSGERPSKLFEPSWGGIDSLLFVWVWCPVDIHLADPLGNEVGQDFASDTEVNGLERAFYSGADEEFEFITIIDPEPGQYEISVRGSGAGAYMIGARLLKDGVIYNDDEYRMSGGVADSGRIDTFIFTVSEEETSELSKDSISFADLLADIEALEEQGEFKKHNIYHLLRIKYNHLSKIDEQISEEGASWKNRLLKKRLLWGLRITEKTLGLYKRKGWITQAAYSVLMTDVHSLIIAMQ